MEERLEKGRGEDEMKGEEEKGNMKEKNPNTPTRDPILGPISVWVQPLTSKDPTQHHPFINRLSIQEAVQNVCIFFGSEGFPWT